MRMRMRSSSKEAMSAHQLDPPTGCGARVTGPDPFAVTGLLVREAPRAGVSAPRAPLTGPELLSRRDFEGECERPELYERFGFTNLRSVSDSAARTAALAAS